MELTTALSFIGIALAAGVSFRAIQLPARRARRSAELEARLNWRQGNQPAAPASHARITYAR